MVLKSETNGRYPKLASLLMTCIWAGGLKILSWLLKDPLRAFSEYSLQVKIPTTNLDSLSQRLCSLGVQSLDPHGACTVECF